MYTVSYGDILLTRNSDAVGNSSPGYWNHCAIVGLQNWVIEAQEEPGLVIKVPVKHFMERYPLIMCLSPIKMARLDMAVAAEYLLGKKYAKLGSWFPHFGKENCVSVVKKAYIAGYGEDPKWKRPDHIERADAGSLAFVWKYHNHQWVQPEEWLRGWTTEKIKGLELLKRKHD